MAWAIAARATILGERDPDAVEALLYGLPTPPTAAPEAFTAIGSGTTSPARRP